jgi:hypothetical protein
MQGDSATRQPSARPLQVGWCFRCVSSQSSKADMKDWSAGHHLEGDELAGDHLMRAAHHKEVSKQVMWLHYGRVPVQVSGCWQTNGLP